MSKYLKFKSPAEKEARVLASEFGIKNHGIQYAERIYWNLPDSSLYEEIVFRKEGRIAKSGPILVNTGKHTARAAADKLVVFETTTEENIWWGE